MPLSKIFKRIILPCAAGVAGTDSQHFGPSCENPPPTTKPSSLPIYSKPCSIDCNTKAASTPPSSMEEAVGNIRRELWVWQDNLRGYRHKIVDVYREGFSKADSALEYLRAPSHMPQRLGAIAISGLAGYVFGMRKNKIRRIMYGCGGAAAMAAICYPNEALDYVETVILEARKYFIVAYHFVYGETPKMPGWLEKMTGDLGLTMSKTVDVKTDDKPEETGKPKAIEGGKKKE